MIYKEMISFFESEENILKLLNNLNPTFAKIDYYKNLFQNHSISANSEQCKKALDELTGLFMYLNPILSIAISIKKNEEDKYYVKKRTEMIKELSGKRFISAPLDREASAYVGTYRTVRNLLQSYTDACDKAISSCQSMLKYMGEEIKLNK